MSNEKEEKLREAAENYANKMAENNTDKFAQHSYIDVLRYFKEDFIAGAKWQSEQNIPTVDLTELKKAFREWYVNNKDVFTAYSSIFNWFAPYIHPKQDKESDAVEFGKYLFFTQMGIPPEICDEEIKQLYHQFQNKQ